MGLFNFVKQDNRERILCDVSNEFAAAQVGIIKAHIARGRTNQGTHSVLFLILTHVVFQQLHVKIVSQGLGQFSFTCTSGP